MTETGTPGPDKNASPSTPPPGGAAPAEGESYKPSPAARLKAGLGVGLGMLSGQLKGGLGEVTDFAKNFRVRGKGLLRTIASIPTLLLHGDMGTRVLTLGFLASLALLGVTGNQLLKRLAAAFAKPQVNHVDTAAEARQKQLALMAANVVFLERFTGVLEAGPGEPGAFEVELYVEVDVPETSSVLRAHLSQTREMISTAIQGRKFSTLGTDEGKDALKDDIREAVNRLIKRWSKKGSVKNVFFTHFVMT